ncbi:MAG: hypothetical protein Q8Q31_02820 [Nanoarchaeota archaeon]|nr:hypothetical protein [Nanoarchaeota archaeon]
MENRKGQEEIAGFVAIVLIVSVIIVIFIGASLNNKSYDRRNIILNHYLQSLNQFTTECSSYGSNYRDVADLIRDCHNNRRCSSGEDSCIVLNDTLKEAINSTLTYGVNHSRKGYIFSAIYKNGVQEEKIIVKIFGNCPGDYSKAEAAFADLPGTITTSLQECY